MATTDHPFSVPPGWRRFRDAIGEAVLASGAAGAGPVIALFDTRLPGPEPGRRPGVDAAAALESCLVAYGLPKGGTHSLGDDLLGVVVPTGGPNELHRLVSAVGGAPGSPPFAWGASEFPHDGAGADDLLSVAVGRLGELRAAGDDGIDPVRNPSGGRRAAGVVVACAALLGGVLLPVALTTGPNLFTGSSHGGLIAAQGSHGAGRTKTTPPSPSATVPPQAAPGTTSPPTTSPPGPGGGLDLAGGDGTESEAPSPPTSTPSSGPTTTPTTPPPSPTTTEPGDGGDGGACLLLCGG